MYNSLLILHITGGFISLGAAMWALMTKKGDKWHLYFGRAFVVGMLIVFLTALPMTFLKPNLFLFLVAIFSFYLVFTGWLRARNRSGIPTATDWITALTMMIVAIVMVIRGLFMLWTGNAMGLVLLTFSGIGGAFAVKDAYFLRSRKYRGTARIADHLSRMLGGAIATVTAFSVVNIKVEPAFVVWLAPTILLTPLIVYWNVRVRHPAHTQMISCNKFSQEVQS